MFGRDSELATCTPYLEREEHVVLTGCGGIGKTALAEALAAHASSSLDFESVIYVDCEGLASAAALLERLLVPSDIPLDHRLWSLACPVLLFLDQLDDLVGTDGDEATSLLRTLASCWSITLLLTTRDTAFLRASTTPISSRSLHLVRLGPLDDASSRSLFRHASASAPTSDADLPSLIKKMDGLPLVILITAGFARTPGITVARILDHSVRSGLLPDGDGDRLSSWRRSFQASLRLAGREAELAGARSLLRLVATQVASVGLSDLIGVGSTLEFEATAW